MTHTRARVWMVSGAFAASFACMWIALDLCTNATPLDSRRPPTSRDEPPVGAGVTWRGVGEVPVRRMGDTEVTVEERMIRDRGWPAEVTWAAVDRARMDLYNTRLAAGASREPPCLPEDCLVGVDPMVAAPTVELSVVVTPDRVTIGGYRVRSSSLPTVAVACLERYFAGEASVTASPEHGPFVELQTRIEQVDDWLRR